MNYGLPYIGSKNKLATSIIAALPKHRHFVDLFCGGCAVTHAALLSRKYGMVIANDIDGAPVRAERTGGEGMHGRATAH